MINVIIVWNGDAYRPSVIACNVPTAWRLWYELNEKPHHKVYLRDPNSGNLIDPQQGIAGTYAQLSQQYTVS